VEHLLVPTANAEKVRSSEPNAENNRSSEPNGDPVLRETRVRLTEGTLNDLLAHCIAQEIQLHSVEEMRPGFHEIFIKTVKESQP